MYKVIIIDDEPLARELVRSLLKANPEMEVVAECGDGFEGYKAIQEHQPDLVFLDVQMPRLNGFEMLELMEIPPSVIFTTAFDEFALRAFEANAVDYLLKPLVKERFDRALKNWLQKRPVAAPEVPQLIEQSLNGAYQHRIVVKDKGMIRIIPGNDIQYIEADDDYIRVFTATGHYLKKATLSHVEQTLDPEQFVRVHRSYLIPVSQLQRIEPYEKEGHMALLHCGAKVPVSKAGFTRLKTLLGW